jgi:hypothetical protein
LTADLPRATTSSPNKTNSASRLPRWPLGRQSKLTTSSKLLAYKVVLKPIWTYGLQLWCTTSTSNIEILEGFQSKALRITDAPWYVPNAVLRRDLHIPSVKEEIQRLSTQYSARLNFHPNLLTPNLKKQQTKKTFATPPANRSAHQISSRNLDCIPRFKLNLSLSLKSQRAPDPIPTIEEC